jgi:hypothetical protein
VQTPTAAQLGQLGICCYMICIYRIYTDEGVNIVMLMVTIKWVNDLGKYVLF